MSNVLVLVPPDRQVTRAIAAALDLASERRAGLMAAVVIDVDASDRLSDRMTDVGFLGEKMTGQVSETLAREHRVRGEALLAEIAEQARARGIECRTSIEAGDPGEVCRHLIATADVVAAIIVAEKRSWIARILTGGQPLQPPALGGCEVTVVEED